jgi:hypothetical protein
MRAVFPKSRIATGEAAAFYPAAGYGVVEPFDIWPAILSGTAGFLGAFSNFAR